MQAKEFPTEELSRSVRLVAVALCISLAFCSALFQFLCNFIKLNRLTEHSVDFRSSNRQ